MELDDFKKINKLSVKEDKNLNEEQMGKIFLKVRENFARQKKTAIKVAAFNLILAIVYATILKKDDTVYNAGLTLICTGLFIGSIYTFLKSRKFNNSFYSLPLMTFLSQTEKKLEFMSLYDWLFVAPALTLLGTGGGFILVNRLSRYISNTELIIFFWVIFFISLIIFALIVSRKDWKKEHGPLLDEVRKIRMSLSEKAE